MCGIAGYATIGSGRPAEPEWIHGMLSMLHHRGPDDRGSVAFPDAVLGNTRLSIIDVEGGHQPIENEDGTVTVVYNGEIYNSPELRRELMAKGHHFATSTDTEVLVHLYEEEDLGFLARLNGMFGLALYDRPRRRLLVARDRFGVKPLFWSHRDGMLAFASEIKSLKTLPGFDGTLDPEGISVFLGLFYVPEPWTVYRHVRRLRPGHALVLSDAGLEDVEYFDLDYSHKLKIGRAEAEDQASSLLREAVGRQLLSDVPVGVLLSGGLDSRSVLAAAAGFNPGTRSFTITFEEAAFDEGGEAAHWAGLFDSPHDQMLFNELAFCEMYLRRQRHLDEPYALWCNVATEALARTIQRAGYKVVLSGEGGDETFLGYPTIHAANAFRYYRRLPRAFREKVIQPLVNRIPAGRSRLPLAFKLKSFVDADNSDLLRVFFGFKEVVRYALWPKLLTGEALSMVGRIDPFIAMDQYRTRIADLSLVDGLSYLDFKVFLPGSSFYGNDNAYMAASVESRVPFMDNDLVDFSCSLPVDIRFHPLKPKIVLRNALMRGFTPPGERNGAPRKYRKLGFEVPGSVWIRRPAFGGLVARVLSRERLERTAFFRADAVGRLLEEQLSGRHNHERVLQAVMSLVLFLDDGYGE